MGIDIKRNKKGLYKAKSTVSDEFLTDKVWVTEDEFKKMLINRAYWRFVEDVIKIDMEFPSGYCVNNKHEFIEEKAGVGSKWMINNWNDKSFISKYKEICERLKIEL